MRCLRHSWFPAYLTKVAAGPDSSRRRPANLPETLGCALELVSPSGTVIARSQNDGLAAETLNGTVTATGRYSVRVYGFGTARSAQPYRLVITVP